MKRMLFFSHSVTADDRWLARLSPIRTLGPGGKALKYGNTILVNQSSKILPSNHPDRERLYLALDGPFSVQVFHR